MIEVETAEVILQPALKGRCRLRGKGSYLLYGYS
jgi:hypothetical protein